MSTLKTYGTIAIMIACFAIVYPRFMHPLVLRIVGLQPEAAKNNADDMYPPNLRGAPPGQKPNQDKDDIRRHMRPGPHPGMRAAAEMHRQQAQQGSGRGMMGIVLPMYAVGIVLYLGYTLFKVFNRGDKKNSQWANKRNYYNKGRGSSPEHDRMGFPSNFEGAPENIKDFLQDEDQRRNLEDLLTRVDDKNVSVEEMRILQKRLEETEAQMSRILKAMHNVQANVDTMSDNQESPSPDGETPKQQGEDSKAETRPQKLNTEQQSPSNAGKKEQSNMDRAGVEQDRVGDDEDTEDNEANSDEDGSEDQEVNDAFDVEEAAEGDEEDDQGADEVIPDKSNAEKPDDKNAARHRNVKKGKHH